MNDQQIKQLIARARRGISVRTFKTSCLGWGLAVISSSALWGASQQGLAILMGLLQLLPAVQISRNAAYDWREFNRAPAWRTWRELTQNSHLFTPFSTESEQLVHSLQNLYRDDPRGEVLPLIQATRLLFIYNLQQQRLQVLLKRGASLRSVREQLLEKSARLHQLGDASSTVEASANELEQEMATLEQLTSDISASCHRLETIALTTQKAVQVKQLHREIAELKSSVLPAKNSPTQPALPEITDIERQIGREIETYLQLERETDAHLRDL